ncbi:glycosylphosphatidylinositol-anchored lipid protein transfer 5 [Hibiscus trionum]|uniref:Glycosylphosphatidylinositol-anchored lipid protein transfer 5 n=1 Tax=Hibiscus trionum TaxID=183268 RepID=A0A9W7HHU0_HIBTR|nr:glycosylphosphatidylinositol-anchored lipid protein transfer 5 [Hibiscus trionum]
MAARNMSGTVFGAGFIVAVCLCTGALAESSSSCTNVLISMSPCLTYIQGNSATPSPSCCTQLANVVGGSQPRCLCEVLNGGGSTLGIKVNRTQAMALPAACNVKTPPVSRCNDGGPKAVPPADDGSGTAGRNSTKLLFSLLFFLLLSFVAI